MTGLIDRRLVVNYKFYFSFKDACHFHRNLGERDWCFFRPTLFFIYLLMHLFNYLVYVLYRYQEYLTLRVWLALHFVSNLKLAIFENIMSSQSRGILPRINMHLNI